MFNHYVFIDLGNENGQNLNLKKINLKGENDKEYYGKF